MNSSKSDPPIKKLKRSYITDYFVSSSSEQGPSDNHYKTTLPSNSNPFYEDMSSKEIAKVMEEVPIYFGKSISEMRRKPSCCSESKNLKPSPQHTVLFNVITMKEKLEPYPKGYVDKWHESYVRLPCSPQNLYPVILENNQKKLMNRWSLVKENLKAAIKTADDLEEKILTYNSRFKHLWDFSALKKYISEILDPSERQEFFDVLLPSMIKLALDLPNLITQGIPLLTCQTEHSISMTQKQISCLLANAFFCTFPRRNSLHKQSEYFRYPDINFIPLYSSKDRSGHEERKFEKFKCLFNYFKRVTLKDPEGVVTFHRKCNKYWPSWENSQAELCDIHISSTGRIEQEDGMLQVDFANKRVGGGVLRRGCVQEEILFLLYPELLVSRLFTEILEVNETLIITGCERFNVSSGYSKTFLWESNYSETLMRDNWRRLNREFVAVDAVRFPSKNSPIQYEMGSIIRDLKKSYVAFSSNSSDDLPAVATGNWGCGAFNGDPRLKFLIQLISASISGREMIYFTFEDHNLCENLFKMYKLFKRRNYVVADIYKLFENYQDVLFSKKSNIKSKSSSFYSYILNEVNKCNSVDTDMEVYSPLQNSSAEDDSQQTEIIGQSQDLFEDSDDELWLKKLYGHDND